MENEGAFPPTRLEFLASALVYLQYCKLGGDLKLENVAEEIFANVRRIAKRPAAEKGELLFDATEAERNAANWFDAMKGLAKERVR